MARGAGRLDQRVAFDSPATTADVYGGQSLTWVEQHACAAQFLFRRGQEIVDAAALAGQALIKVRVRSSSETRAVTPGWRMRDVRRSVAYNIRSVDALSDRAWVFIEAESGVAV